MKRFAVVLTHNRHELLRECIDAITPQVDVVIVIDNASEPRVQFNDVFLTYVPDQPPNLAHLWNVGFDIAAELTNANEFDVAVLCDDVVTPVDWFRAIAGQLRVTGAIAGSTHAFAPVSTPIIKTIPDRDIMNRMQGSAFVIAGEAKIRADERMHWWWQDTDIDWQARGAGGMIIAPGPVAHNRYPNDYTARRPELYARIEHDAAAFREKWGFQPW